MKKRFLGYIIASALTVAVLCPAAYGMDSGKDAYTAALANYGVETTVDTEETIPEGVTVIEDAPVPLAGTVSSVPVGMVYLGWTALLAMLAMAGDVVFHKFHIVAFDSELED